MNVTVLISKTSWAQNYKKQIKKKIKKYCKNIKFSSNHKLIRKKNDINIIFSYFKIIENKYLSYSKYNLIPHESNLPLGKGMSPLTWQILKGRTKIVFSLIEAQKKIYSVRKFLCGMKVHCDINMPQIFPQSYNVFQNISVPITECT